MGALVDLLRMTPPGQSAQASLKALHTEIDTRAGALTVIHQSRLQCKRGCADCCVDDLSVFDVEAQRIRAAFPKLLAEGRAHPEGACAFLDEAGACRVYEARPYVCRTQGLPLRWQDEDDAGEIAEYRDICGLNEAGGPELVELAESECWTLGEFEGQLATLQVVEAGGLVRVRLRDLFVGS